LHSLWTFSFYYHSGTLLFASRKAANPAARKMQHRKKEEAEEEAKNVLLKPACKRYIFLGEGSRSGEAWLVKFGIQVCWVWLGWREAQRKGG
jgi:hypothetical protein